MHSLGIIMVFSSCFLDYVMRTTSLCVYIPSALPVVKITHPNRGVLERTGSHRQWA